MKAALFIWESVFQGERPFYLEFVQESTLQTDGDRAAEWTEFQQELCLCPLIMYLLYVMHLKCMFVYFPHAAKCDFLSHVKTGFSHKS